MSIPSPRPGISKASGRKQIPGGFDAAAGQSDSTRTGAAGTLLPQGRTEDGQAKRKIPGPGRPRSRHQQLGTHTWPAESPRAPSAPTMLKHNGDSLSRGAGDGPPSGSEGKGAGSGALPAPNRGCAEPGGRARCPPRGRGSMAEGSAPLGSSPAPGGHGEHGAATQLGQQHKRQQVQGTGSLRSMLSPPPGPAALAQLQHGTVAGGRRTRGGPRQQRPRHGPRHPGTSGGVPAAGSPRGVPLEKGVLWACSRIFTTSSGVTATTAPPSATSRGAPPCAPPPAPRSSPKSEVRMAPVPEASICCRGVMPPPGPGDVFSAMALPSWNIKMGRGGPPEPTGGAGHGSGPSIPAATPLRAPLSARRRAGAAPVPPLPP